jgi:C4-dicarboxylate-specific signal transduction histidine kinase
MNKCSDRKHSGSGTSAKQNKNIFAACRFRFFLAMAFILAQQHAKAKAKVKIEEAYEVLKSTQAQLINQKNGLSWRATAGIAHEIQNPLNFVNNFSDVNKELLSEMKDEMKKGNLAEAETIANDVTENEQKINHHGKGRGHSKKECCSIQEQAAGKTYRY